MSASTATDTRSRFEPTTRTRSRLGSKRPSTGSIIALIIAVIVLVILLS